MLKPEQIEEWNSYMELTKADLILHMNELAEQLESTTGVHISAALQTNANIVIDLLRQYTARSDRDKAQFFDIEVDKAAEAVIDMTITQSKAAH